MRFRNQQNLVVYSSVGFLLCTYFGRYFVFSVVPMGLVLVGVLASLCGLLFAFIRFGYWLAWGAPRGDVFYAQIQTSQFELLNGPRNGFWRWFCHVDEFGNDLDVEKNVGQTGKTISQND